MNFSRIIYGWYEKNLRDLPMRHTRDPYRTWVAEVILQQTRMDQGLPYLTAFLSSFPDLQALASASEDEVLRHWQGLGYYSRARNLHASARYVTEELGGVMPRDYKGLLALKGVGKYTAAAIASWCYGEACAAVDGNVARVIARLFGIQDPVNTGAGEKKVYALAGELLDRADPGRHNQAMIDFGALQCIPVSPLCGECPVSAAGGCEAYRLGLVDRIPVRVRNKKPAERWFYYYILRTGGQMILTRRETGDIWAGLYEPPMAESPAPLNEEEIIHRMLPQLLQEPLPSCGSTEIGRLSAPVRHQLSHQTIHARFLHVDLETLPRPLPPNWQPVPLSELDRYAMPRLIRRYLESVKN
jgi:A/G-specific adenine glycosylase